MRSIRARRDPRDRRRLDARLPLGLGLAAVVVVAAPLGCEESLAPPMPAPEHPGGPPQRGGTLRLASFQDVRTLDPAGPVDGVSQPIEHLLFAGLVDYDEQAHVVPDLADHWVIEDGGRTYRFYLRPGSLMHDGNELTAADVKRSAERALHPTTPNPFASYFQNLLGYDSYLGGRTDHLGGIVTEGRYVVSFRLQEPDATFLPVLAMHTLRPVCANAGDRYDDTWLPCGAGPFRLLPGDWQHGTSLRIVRHDEYFRAGLPYLDAVEWTFNMQVPAQRFRLEDGTLDLVRDLTQPDQARFAADPRWAALGTAEADRSVLGESMNTSMPPFDNVEIRRAVAAAIDRNHYRMLKPAYLTVLTQILPPATPGYDPTAAGQRHDYAEALDHMRKAGYPYDPATGIGGWPAPVRYPLYDRGLLVYTAQLLQQDLARIGLRIELQLVSWPAFLALQQRRGGAAMSQANWQLDYPDPSAIFDPVFTTAAIGPESSYNTAFYSNPRVDDLVARARREVDGRRRATLYRDANEILCDEAPWAFTLGYHFYDVRQPYVRGFVPHPVWSMDVSRVWLDRASGALARALGARGGGAWR